MKKSEITNLVRQFGKAYRENISPLAVDMREQLFDTSALLGLDPKFLMRALVTQRPTWKGVPAASRVDLDLALRLMSAEDETIRTINAKPSDEALVTQGVKLLGLWAKTDFRKGIVKEALETARPRVQRLRKAYPGVDQETLIFFLLEQFQTQLVNSPTSFKDSGLLEDILQKMLM